MILKKIYVHDRRFLGYLMKKGWESTFISPYKFPFL